MTKTIKQVVEGLSEEACRSLARAALEDFFNEKIKSTLIRINQVSQRVSCSPGLPGFYEDAKAIISCSYERRRGYFIGLGVNPELFQQYDFLYEQAKVGQLNERELKEVKTK
ncbi:hypothetical protein KA107_02610 [Candidatus Pacearchaeota archaeon]|nr:hypothetical protein [Candidatus Pacearchaeota archaeon]